MSSFSYFIFIDSCPAFFPSVPSFPDSSPFIHSQILYYFDCCVSFLSPLRLLLSPLVPMSLKPHLVFYVCLLYPHNCIAYRFSEGLSIYCSLFILQRCTNTSAYGRESQDAEMFFVCAVDVSYSSGRKRRCSSQLDRTNNINNKTYHTTILEKEL